MEYGRKGRSLSGPVGEAISCYECCADISIFSPPSFWLVGKISAIMSLSHKLACSFCLRFFLF